MNHCRGVIFGIDALASRVCQDRGAQQVVGVVIGAAHAFINHVFHAHLSVPLDVHADADEHGDDAGVLTQRAMAFGAHTRVDQDLCHRVFRSL